MTTIKYFFISQIRTSNDTWYPVCSDAWNSTYSDQVCQSFGYAGSTSTEFVNSTTPSNYFKLKSDHLLGALLSQFEKTEKCDSVVQITCQEFCKSNFQLKLYSHSTNFSLACGSHSTLDGQSARIIGGNDAVDTQWPSVALLYDKKRNLQCTASILTPLWVMASYSCVVEADNSVKPLDWTLYAGGTNFFSEMNNTSTQSKIVENIVTYPQVTKMHLFNCCVNLIVFNCND